jgi:hypothetical protein
LPSDSTTTTTTTTTASTSAVDPYAVPDIDYEIEQVEVHVCSRFEQQEDNLRKLQTLLGLTDQQVSLTELHSLLHSVSMRQLQLNKLQELDTPEWFWRWNGYDVDSEDDLVAY